MIGTMFEFLAKEIKSFFLPESLVHFERLLNVDYIIFTAPVDSQMPYPQTAASNQPSPRTVHYIVAEPGHQGRRIISYRLWYKYCNHDVNLDIQPKLYK